MLPHVATVPQTLHIFCIRALKVFLFKSKGKNFSTSMEITLLNASSKIAKGSSEFLFKNKNKDLFCGD